MVGRGLISDCLALQCVYSQSLFPYLSYIIDRHIFAFCHGELKAQRKSLCFVLIFL